MNATVLQNMQCHFKAVHIYPDKPLVTLYDLDQFLYELYEKASASSTALYSMKVSMLAEFLLNEAIQQEHFSGVKMLLKYAKCSGFAMRELFQKKKYEMIYTIASSGRVWGSAQHVLDITHSRPTPGVFSNEDGYLEWLSENKEL
jgi:hypothetical protein